MERPIQLTSVPRPLELNPNAETSPHASTAASAPADEPERGMLTGTRWSPCWPCDPCPISPLPQPRWPESKRKAALPPAQCPGQSGLCWWSPPYPTVPDAWAPCGADGSDCASQGPHAQAAGKRPRSAASEGRCHSLGVWVRVWQCPGHSHGAEQTVHVIVQPQGARPAADPVHPSGPSTLSRTCHAFHIGGGCPW